jgi:hypothetical protein
MYNENFSPQICRKFLTPIVKAFYKHITYNNLFNDKDNINVAIRYKLYDDKKYLIEVELFITPTTNQRMFQNIFYVYYNECSDKMDLLKKILENWHNNTNDINTLNNMLTNTNNKIKNEGLIINFYQNDNDNQLFLDGISNLKEFEIINIIKNSEKNIESNLNENMDKLKSVGYNFKYNDVEYNSQNKLSNETNENNESNPFINNNSLKINKISKKLTEKNIESNLNENNNNLNEIKNNKENEETIKLMAEKIKNLQMELEKTKEAKDGIVAIYDKKKEEYENRIKKEFELISSAMCNLGFSYYSMKYSYEEKLKHNPNWLTKIRQKQYNGDY